MPHPLRYRPFRASAWALYLALALSFCGLVIWGVVGRVLADRQEALKVAGATDPTGCGRELAALYAQVHDELDRQRRTGATGDGRGWNGLRLELAALGKRCQLQGASGTPLGKAYARVVAFQRQAESASIQYRQEVGPADAEAAQLLQAARATAP